MGCYPWEDFRRVRPPTLRQPPTRADVGLAHDLTWMFLNLRHVPDAIAGLLELLVSSGMAASQTVVHCAHPRRSRRFGGRRTSTGFPSSTEPSLALDLRTEDTVHSLFWFNECGLDDEAYCIEGTVTFDDLKVLRADQTPEPLDAKT